MTKLLILLAFGSITSVFANTSSVYRFDDVDTVITNGRSVAVEDLRDGFSSITGVKVNENTVTVTNDSKISIILRNPVPFKIPAISTMGAKIGGDGGGG